MLIASGGLAAVSTALASFLGSFIRSARCGWRMIFICRSGRSWRLGIQQVVAVGVILVFCDQRPRCRLWGQVQWAATCQAAGIAIVVLGAFLLSKPVRGRTSRSRNSAPRPSRVGAFGAAMIAALWAYQGWANVPMVAGESRSRAQCPARR